MYHEAKAFGQSRLRSDVGHKVPCKCLDCGHNIGTIVYSWLGTAKSPDPELGILYPDMKLIQCNACHMKRAVSHSRFPYDDWKIWDEDSPVDSAYTEARQCVSRGYYTAVPMLCRRLLMLFASDFRAKKGASYTTYIKHMKGTDLASSIMHLLEYVRASGNAANHDLEPVSQDTAYKTFTIMTAVLYATYEEVMNESAESYCPPV